MCGCMTCVRLFTCGGRSGISSKPSYSQMSSDYEISYCGSFQAQNVRS